MTDLIYELRAIALQYRTDAVDAMERNDLRKAEQLEQAADRIYEEARKLGDVGYVVPRLKPDEMTQTRFCVVCRGKFRAERSTAKYCSDRCRQKAQRARE